MSLKATRRLERVLALVLAVLLGIIAIMIIKGPPTAAPSVAVSAGAATPELDSAETPPTVAGNTSTNTSTNASDDGGRSASAAGVEQASATPEPAESAATTVDGVRASTLPNTQPQVAPNGASVLLYSETGNTSTGEAAFVHEATPGAVTVLAGLAADLGMAVTVASESGPDESAPYFSSCDRLKEFDVLVFVNTTGNDILDSAERDAMECWSADPDSAPGFLAIHAAAEGLEDWDYFNDLVGARFNGHARAQAGELYVNIDAASHPSVASLPTVATRAPEEWFVFRDGGQERVFEPWNPRDRDGLTVVLDVDEASYFARDYDYPRRGEEEERMFYGAEIPGQPGSLGRNHPIAWYQEFDGDPVFGNTRSFYTSLGHGGSPPADRTAVWAGYADMYMKGHLIGALEWVSGQ